MEAKKNPNLDIYNMSHLFFSIGLVISMSLVYGVFHIKFEDAPIELRDGEHFNSLEQLIDVPITVQPAPPPPEVLIHKIIEASNEEVAVENIPIIDMEMQENTQIEAKTYQEVIIDMEMPEEVADEIFTIVEVQATPVGGVEAFYEYVANQLKDNYPYTAARMNISGVVYIQFIVEKDGSITHVESVKGIGGGCDELAVEVLEGAPNWNPGKQRGVPVRTRKMVPIRFMLKVK